MMLKPLNIVLAVILGFFAFASVMMGFSYAPLITLFLLFFIPSVPFIIWKLTPKTPNQEPVKRHYPLKRMFFALFFAAMIFSANSDKAKEDTVKREAEEARAAWEAEEVKRKAEIESLKMCLIDGTQVHSELGSKLNNRVYQHLNDCIFKKSSNGKYDFKLTFSSGAAWDEASLKRGLQIQAADLIREIFKSDYPVNSISISAFGAMSDRYGYEHSREIYTVRLDGETGRRINWDADTDVNLTDVVISNSEESGPAVFW